MPHTAYIHKEAGESSLRCKCGRWKGKSLVDMEGHAQHVLVTSPAYRALRRVFAAWTGTDQRIAFTRPTGIGYVERVDDEFAAEQELIAELLAAVEPHLAAEHREDAADRIEQAGPQNGERGWPFALLLRQDAERIRTEIEGARHAPARAAFAEFAARPTDTRTTAQEASDAE
jgi:hypothetical protein